MDGKKSLTFVLVLVILVLLIIGAFYSPMVVMALCSILQAVALLSICFSIDEIKELIQNEKA